MPDTMHRIWHKYRDILLYIIFGGLTTVINYVAFVVFRSLGLGLQTANATAWVFAVTFAYFTNRIWVFQSKATGFYPILREVVSFYLFRLLSLGMEAPMLQALVYGIKTEAVLLIMGRSLRVDELISKVITNVVVIIINYIFSKFLIFRTRNKEVDEKK
jgi:putative flippase GtrA